MKRLGLIFIILFSLLIVNGVEYQCYESEDSFTIVENIMLDNYNFAENGIKFEYFTDSSTEDEKERILSILSNDSNIVIKEANNNIVATSNYCDYHINIVDIDKTKVEIVLINENEDIKTTNLRQAVELLKDNQCKDERYYYFVKAKVNEENKNTKSISRGEVIKTYIPYVIEELEKGSNVHALAAPLQSLFQGQKGSRKFKQLLSSSNVKKETLVDVLNNILEVMPQDILWDI